MKPPGGQEQGFSAHLQQGLAKPFRKGPEHTYFWLCKPGHPGGTSVTLLAESKSSPRSRIHKGDGSVAIKLDLQKISSTRFGP